LTGSRNTQLPEGVDVVAFYASLARDEALDKTLAPAGQAAFQPTKSNPVQSNPALMTVALTVTIGVEENSCLQFNSLQSHSIPPIATI